LKAALWHAGSKLFLELIKKGYLLALCLTNYYGMHMYHKFSRFQFNQILLCLLVYYIFKIGLLSNSANLFSK